MKPRHLAILCEHLIPHDKAGEQAIQLARYFVEQGWRVSVLCGAERDTSLPDGAELICMGRRIPRLIHHLVRLRRWFRQSLAQLAADAVVSTTTLAPGDIVVPCIGTRAAYGKALRAMPGALPARLSAWRTTLRPSQLLRVLAEKRTLADPSVKACVALTGVIEAELESAKSKGASEIVRAEALSLDVDPARPDTQHIRAQLARAWDMPDGSAWLVFPFNDAWLAGIEPLLLAFKSLIDGGTDAVLLLAGRTRYTYLAWIAQLGLREHVRFIGQPDRPEQLFAVADLVVIPAAYDPGGWQARPALACGKPVVATTASGVADQVRHQGGVVLDLPIDPAALAAVLRERINRLSEPATADSGPHEPVGGDGHDLAEVVHRLVEGENSA